LRFRNLQEKLEKEKHIWQNLFNVSNNWWLKFIEEILWKQKFFEKLKWNFRNILNLLWAGQQKCCVRTVQCSGSKQKSQLFHYTITIVTANHNWWHEKIWITSNEFLIGIRYVSCLFHTASYYAKIGLWDE
jgi:hypothetical protein